MLIASIMLPFAPVRSKASACENRRARLGWSNLIAHTPVDVLARLGVRQGTTALSAGVVLGARGQLLIPNEVASTEHGAPVVVLVESACACVSGVKR